MPGIPRDVTLKVERAREHLNSVRDEVSRLLRGLGEHGVIRETDLGTGHWVWKLNADPATTQRVSVLAGDFVHNLRAALDYLVWELSTKTQQRHPLPEFPIYQKPGPGGDGFHGSGIGKIRTLPEPAKVLIERLQPYQGGNEALRDIQTLDNIDKHRRLAVIPYGIVRSSVSGQFTLHGGSMLNFMSGRFQDGHVLMVANGINPLEEVEKVKFDVTFQIELEEDGVSGEIVGKLSPLYEFVCDRVLPEFEPLFS